MKDIRISCPCGCESELSIGIAEEGDMFEDYGKLLISVGKKGQKEHEFAVVINDELLNKISELHSKTDNLINKKSDINYLSKDKINWRDMICCDNCGEIKSEHFKFGYCKDKVYYNRNDTKFNSQLKNSLSFR